MSWIVGIVGAIIIWYAIKHGFAAPRHDRPQIFWSAPVNLLVLLVGVGLVTYAIL